jgi:hypothetical protein
MSDPVVDIVKKMYGEGEAPVKGAPPTNQISVAGQVLELLDLAIADKGEWYSVPLPEGSNQGGIASTAAQTIGRYFADISTKEGRLWLRIK